MIRRTVLPLALSALVLTGCADATSQTADEDEARTVAETTATASPSSSPPPFTPLTQDEAQRVIVDATAALMASGTLSFAAEYDGLLGTALDSAGQMDLDTGSFRWKSSPLGDDQMSLESRLVGRFRYAGIDAGVVDDVGNPRICWIQTDAEQLRQLTESSGNTFVRRFGHTDGVLGMHYVLPFLGLDASARQPDEPGRIAVELPFIGAFAIAFPNALKRDPLVEAIERSRLRMRAPFRVTLDIVDSEYVGMEVALGDIWSRFDDEGVDLPDEMKQVRDLGPDGSVTVTLSGLGDPVDIPRPPARDVVVLGATPPPHCDIPG